MHLNDVRLPRILKLCCLIFICISLTGCLSVFGPGGCGHPPEADNPNLLVIRQQEDYRRQPKFENMVTYDSTAVYYLCNTEGGSRLYRAEPGQEPKVLYMFKHPVQEIASWGDTLLVYGQLPLEEGQKEKQKNGANREEYGIYLLYKKDTVLSPVVTMKDPEAYRGIILQNRTNYMRRERFALRAVFNEETIGEPFAYLLDALYPQWLGRDISTEDQQTVLRLFGNQLEKEYTIPGFYWGDIWMLEGGSLIVSGRYEDGMYGDIGYTRLDSKARNGGPTYGGNGYLFYENAPYGIYASSNDISITPARELSKSEFVAVLRPERERFMKWYSGQRGRMQYLVVSSHTNQIEIYGEEDFNDVKYAIGHKILALDLDTMQQTKELALTTPREQVLYVSEAGAYTWRHDESRIFLTNWEGQSKPVSDTIPYTPRYETDEDRAQNDACNTWYVEVDPERSRLLIFDMTQGETALLAVVPVE
ncbi:MAG TPA: hypothetical protein VN366_08175 [Feifaniaceae bacterium]|nr:hypothetical protein [Feifaniaceae bacterium]